MRHKVQEIGGDKLSEQARIVKYKQEAPNTQTGGARGRGRPKCIPDSTQFDLIVNCARRLFVKKGYGATTTDEIAAECKISKQTMYRLFPGKAALFAAVVEAHRQKWLNLPRDDDDQPLAQTLAQIFMIDISDEADQERVDVIRLVLAEGRNFPELAAILKEHGAEFSRTQLAAWLARQCAAGRLQMRNTIGMAQILLDMVFGAILIKNIGDIDWPAGEQRRNLIRDCIDIFLHGVATAA
jgi:TetR/AcrR family transcriptional repressor of mexJK operon